MFQNVATYIKKRLSQQDADQSNTLTDPVNVKNVPLSLDMALPEKKDISYQATAVALDLRRDTPRSKLQLHLDIPPLSASYLDGTSPALFLEELPEDPAMSYMSFVNVFGGKFAYFSFT